MRSVNYARPTPALAIHDLRKSYGDLHALKGVTFGLNRGERLAFLGPNGAGKTTLIRCLAGLTSADHGEIFLAGQPFKSSEARQQIGFVPQEIALYADLTTRQNLEAFGRFHGLRRRVLRDRLAWALRWTGLEDRADDLVGAFSGGMQRRVNLACGVMHEPRILLLDEPTVGVDPQSRQRIFMMLDELSATGTSILLTTHHLDEAEERSDRIVILDQGMVVADGSLDELVEQSVGTQRLVRLRIDRPLSAPIRAGVAEHAASFGATGEEEISTRIDDVSDHLPGLIDLVRRRGYGIADVQVEAPSLHHVFLHLTGYELRD
ncbi:MAG TPA: ABC transporter ATP-binding protein [Rhodopirellula sp.]|nr:MAG: multidrug ABC transporter ATP-binding protein [Saprospirales bacterium TMED214]HBV65443.1 ABC transporter ATP-binding protein [Rhodopirellula sp.]